MSKETRKQERDRIWKEFKKGRAQAKHREYMKKHPLRKMSVKSAFKQKNLAQAAWDFDSHTDGKIKNLERNLAIVQPKVVSHPDEQQYPRKGGGTRRKRKRRRKSTKKKRRRKRTKKKRRRKRRRSRR